MILQWITTNHHDVRLTRQVLQASEIINTIVFYDCVLAQSQIVHENNEPIEEEEHAVNHFEESLDAPAKQA